MDKSRSTSEQTTRRNFLKKTAAVTAAGLTASSLLTSSGCSENMKCPLSGATCSLTEKNNVILFQGDSITDFGRDKRNQSNAHDSRALGSGYVLLAASELLDKYCRAKPKIYNRGISGNKVFQLAERWDADCIDLKPDIVSILETYEKDYRALIQRTRDALPEVRLVICEPFVLRCGEVDDKWFPAFDGYRAAAKKVAAECKAIFVPFQSIFDKAAENAPAQYWAADGVHPTLAGAHLMAKAWLKAVLG